MSKWNCSQKPDLYVTFPTNLASKKGNSLNLTCKCKMVSAKLLLLQIYHRPIFIILVVIQTPITASRIDRIANWFYQGIYMLHCTVLHYLSVYVEQQVTHSAVVVQTLKRNETTKTKRCICETHHFNENIRKKNKFVTELATIVREYEGQIKS